MLESALKGEPLRIPPDVPFGSFTVQEDAGGNSGGVPDLGLTESQRVLIESLVAEWRRRLEECRAEAGQGPLAAEAALKLAERARRAREDCLASIRSSLLPDQRARFDALVESGKWGSYSFVIPVR